MTNALVTEETKEKVGQLYNNGYKTKEIADCVNYSFKTIEKNNNGITYVRKDRV